MPDLTPTARDDERAAEQLTRWLASPVLEHPSGHCLSWDNPAHVGYPYPEITGLLLSHLAARGEHPARRAALVDALLAEPPAGVGRGPVGWYGFDTAMALAGLVAVLERDDDPGRAAAVRDRARSWAAVLAEAVRDGRARDGQPPLTEDTRWSDSFGAHQSKLAIALTRYARRVATAGGSPAEQDTAAAALAAADELAGHTLALAEPDGRFRIHGKSGACYLHAHCYAVEGLVAQATRADLDAGTAARVREAIDAGVRWLAEVQDPGGGLPAWHDGRAPEGWFRADATAQAARLWLLVDRERYAGPVEAACGFLRRTQGPHPGVPYQPGSLDLNAWASIFTAQALAWRAAAPAPRELV